MEESRRVVLRAFTAPLARVPRAVRARARGPARAALHPRLRVPLRLA
jgi:hypothetical protein